MAKQSAISYELALRRLKVERWRENRRYHQWVAFHNKRPKTPGVERERVKWWKLYTDARIKRIHLEHEVREKAPKYQPGKEASTFGANFIKGFEGYVGHVYDDGTGVRTVGYGHTENVPGNGIWLPHQKWAYHLTEPEASELLRRDLNKNYAPYVRRLGIKMTDRQFTGWLSFVYNCGVGALSEGSIGHYLHLGDQHSAANAMLSWDHAGGVVLPGLRRRREAERNLIIH